MLVDRLIKLISPAEDDDSELPWSHLSRITTNKPAIQWGLVSTSSLNHEAALWLSRLCTSSVGPRQPTNRPAE